MRFSVHEVLDQLLCPRFTLPQDVNEFSATVPISQFWKGSAWPDGLELALIANGDKLCSRFEAKPRELLELWCRHHPGLIKYQDGFAVKGNLALVEKVEILRYRHRFDVSAKFQTSRRSSRQCGSRHLISCGLPDLPCGIKHSRFACSC